MPANLTSRCRRVGGGTDGGRRPRGSSQAPSGLGHTGRACSAPRGHARRRRRCCHSALALLSRLRLPLRPLQPPHAQMAPRSTVLLAAAALSAAMFAGADAQAFVPVRSAAALPLRARRARTTSRDCARLLGCNCLGRKAAALQPLTRRAAPPPRPQVENTHRKVSPSRAARRPLGLLRRSPHRGRFLPRHTSVAAPRHTRLPPPRMLCRRARCSPPRDDSRTSLRPRRSCWPAARRSCAAPRCRWRRRLRPR